MNTKVLLLIIITWSFHSFSQQGVAVGLLPNWNYGVKISSDWKINGKLEGRINSFSTDTTGKLMSNWGFELLDMQSGVSYKTRPNQSVNLGVLVRYREGNFFYRSIQQYTFVNEYQKLELGQRIRTDQTFQSKGSYEIRLRYRITIITSLSGERLDKREPYFKFNNEYLLSYRPAGFSWEIRTEPVIGFGFSDNNKIELGIDYRLRNPFLSSMNHQFWLNMAWYYTFSKN